VSIISCSSPKNNEQLLIDAQTSIAQGDKAEAVINLKNILQSDPNHSDARYLLGKIYFSTNDHLRAEKELLKSVNSNPENNKAILLLAKTQLSLSQFNNVIDTLINKNFTKTEDDIYALVLKGQAYLSLGKINLAKESIQEANDISSESQYSILGNALVSAFENSSEEALTLIDALLKKDSTFQDALLLKGSILSNRHEYKKAAETYLAFFNLNPNHFGIRTLVTHNYIKAGDFELAKPHVEALLKINDNHPTINLLAAQIKYFEQYYEEAKYLATKVINSTNNALAQMIVGLSSFHLGQYEQAYYQLNAIADLLPNDHKVNKVIALLQVKLGFTEELYETLEQLSDLTSDDATLYANIGQELVSNNDRVSAQKMFSKANVLAPDNALIKAQLGMIKLLNTDKTGLDELQQAINLDPNFKAANIALAMTYLKNKEIEKAKKIAEEWLAAKPNNVTAMILRGNIALKANNKEDAIEYFNKVVSLSPKNIVALFNLAVIASDKEQYKKSNNYLEQLFAVDLEYFFAYRLAISNSLKLNSQQQLEEKLLSYIKKSPNAIWPKVIIARRLTLKGEYQHAINILETLDDYKVLPNFYLLTLSNALLMSKNSKKLALMFEQWQYAQPENDAAYLSYIDILNKQENYKLALDVAQKALSNNKLQKHFQLLALESYYLLATNQVELASKKINHLVEIDPDHGFLLRVRGQLSLAQSNYPAAIDYFSRSLQLNKKVDTNLYLMTAYKENGQINKAINLLEAELKLTPNNPRYTRLLAELYATNSPKNAINSYQKLLKKNPNDVVALNNIAWVYIEQNDFDQAIVFSTKAKNIAPNHPQILDTYGLVLTKKNRLEEAIKVLTLANNLLPDDSEIIKHLADAYEANNQPKKAKKLIEKNR